jgi:hypothetical protein
MTALPAPQPSPVEHSRRGNRIGIGVRHGELAVVLVRRDGVCVASDVITFEGHRPVEGDFSRAIEAVQCVEGRRRRLKRTTLHVAIGPNHSQLRRLEAVPALKDPAARRLLLQENVGSFFLKNGVALLVSGSPAPANDGSSWAAAFDAPVIDAVASAARAQGLQDITAVPVSVALSAPGKGRTASYWRDGPVAVEAEFDGDVIERVRRTQATEQLGGCASQIDGSDAPPFADALGSIDRRRHAVRWATPDRWRVRLRAARPWCAIVALFLSVVVLTLGPTLRELRTARINEARLASLNATVNGARSAESDLAKASTTLARLNEFSLRRVGALEVLSILTNALPDSTALLAFHVDSIAGTASIMGRDVITALAAIQASQAFNSVEITSPVLRETVGFTEIERVGVRFKLARRKP